MLRNQNSSISSFSNHPPVILALGDVPLPSGKLASSSNPTMSMSVVSASSPSRKSDPPGPFLPNGKVENRRCVVGGALALRFDVPEP